MTVSPTLEKAVLCPEPSHLDCRVVAFARKEAWAWWGKALSWAWDPQPESLYLAFWTPGPADAAGLSVGAALSQSQAFTVLWDIWYSRVWLSIIPLLI